MRKLPRQVRNASHMAGEKLLSMIERDIGLTLIVLLLGLIYSNKGYRGFPVPWLGMGGIDSVRFLTSAVLLFAAVFVFDSVMIIVNGITDRAPDAIADRSSRPYESVGINTYDDTPYQEQLPDRKVTVRTIPDVKVKQVLRQNTPVRKPSKGLSMKTLVIFIAAISILSTISGMFIDDDNWTEHVVIEDVDSEIYADCVDAFNAMADNDMDAVFSMMDDGTVTENDWHSFMSSIYDLEFDGADIDSEIALIYSGDSESCAEYLRILDGNDNYHIAAFNFRFYNDSETTTPYLTGISIIPDLIHDDTDNIISSVDEEWDEAADRMMTDTVFLGDVFIDGMSMTERLLDEFA